MSKSSPARGTNRGRHFLLRLTKPNTDKSIPRTRATGRSGNDPGIHGPRGPNGFGAKAVTVCGVVVTVIVVLFPGVTAGGIDVAIAPNGKPVAVNVTEPTKVPPTGAVAIANSAGWPGATVCGGVGLDAAKSTIVNVNALEVPPPGVGLNIVMEAVPAV